MHRRLSILALGALLSAAPALAQPPEGENLFISPCGQPFRSHGQEPYPAGAWFVKVDTNKDGAIDREEFRADAEGFFDVLDQDHDKVIESYEVSRYEHQIAPEILSGWQASAQTVGARLFLAQYGNPDDLDNKPYYYNQDASRVPQNTRPSLPKVLEGAAAYNLLDEPEPVTASDLNFDGRITLKEFLTAADRRFARLDKAGTGKLTLATLPMTVSQQYAAQNSRRRRG